VIQLARFAWTIVLQERVWFNFAKLQLDVQGCNLT
jgi:hypothetical protein